MTLSVDSKIKDIMKNPEAVALMEKFTPGFSTNPQTPTWISIYCIKGTILSFIISL